MARATQVPVHVYARSARPTTAEEYAVDRLRSVLERFGQHIRRVGVRIDEVINRHGTVDQVCRVDVTLAAVPDAPKLVVEGRARNEHEAANLAADGVEEAVHREVEEAERVRKRKQKSRLVRGGAARPAAVEQPVPESEAVQRGEGGRTGLTPREAKSASFLRKRGIHKTQRQARATSARELVSGSAPRPSRKSTRKSANRSKRDSNQARRATRATASPEARATRSSTLAR